MSGLAFHTIFHQFSCCLSVVLQLDKRDYPEHLLVLSCPNKQHSFEPFVFGLKESCPHVSRLSKLKSKLFPHSVSRNIHLAVRFKRAFPGRFTLCMLGHSSHLTKLKRECAQQDTITTANSAVTHP